MRCADAYTGVIGALLLCQALSAVPSDGSRKQAVLAGRRGCMLSLLAFDTGRECGCNGHRIALGPARRGGHGESLEMVSTVPGRNGASIRVPWSGYRFLSLLGRGGKCPWFGKKFLTGTDGVLSLCARYRRILGCCGQCKRHIVARLCESCAHSRESLLKDCIKQNQKISGDVRVRCVWRSTALSASLMTCPAVY